MELPSSRFWLWEDTRVSEQRLCDEDKRPSFNILPLFETDEDFTNAEALLLTFSLNNYPRHSAKFKVAMQWETEFLKIVQEYQRNTSNKFTFAYMAEVRPPL